MCEASDVLPVMQATVIGKNIDINAMRQVLLLISYDEKFKDYHTSRQLERSTATLKQELEIVKQKTKDWKIN